MVFLVTLGLFLVKNTIFSLIFSKNAFFNYGQRLYFQNFSGGSAPRPPPGGSRPLDPQFCTLSHCARFARLRSWVRVEKIFKNFSQWFPPWDFLRAAPETIWMLACLHACCFACGTWSRRGPSLGHWGHVPPRKAERVRESWKIKRRIKEKEGKIENLPLIYPYFALIWPKLNFFKVPDPQIWHFRQKLNFSEGFWNAIFKFFWGLRPQTPTRGLTPPGPPSFELKKNFAPPYKKCTVRACVKGPFILPKSKATVASVLNGFCYLNAFWKAQDMGISKSIQVAKSVQNWGYSSVAFWKYEWAWSWRERRGYLVRPSDWVWL